MKELAVLVADDNAVNRKVMGLLLGSMGVQCYCVNDGREAVKAASEQDYDLVLMDCMMPEMDGFQASFEIRKREFGKLQHTPIVACTAMDIDRIFDQCVHSGMDDYIGKPIDIELLKEKIQYWSFVHITMQPMTKALAGRIKQLQASQKLEPIDRDYLNLLYGLQQLDDVMELFLTVTDTLLGQLESAIEHHDVAIVRRMAHEIKGSSYAVSAREMAKLCLELEHAGEEQNWTEAEKLYAALGLAFARVREFLTVKQKLIINASESS
jgi:CheY-like chemotaxis protein/HPt (histidine-containing phosphotransfer) domain-containing protein